MLKGRIINIASVSGQAGQIGQANQDVRGHSIDDWPTEDLESSDRCPVCGSSQRGVLYEGLRDRLFGCPGLWTLLRCVQCGAAYLDPRPTVRAISRAYKQYYTHLPGGDRENTTALSGPHQIRRAVANGYLNRRFGTEYRRAAQLGGWLTQFVPGVRHELDALGRHLPRESAGRRLLDVGCGNGEFLDLARRAGWKVVGVEPDATAAELARSRGLDVRVGSVDALSWSGEVFDVITLSHVIEHVHDPILLLDRCRALLHTRGWLWIDTPNLDSYGHRRYGPAWRGLEPPRHLVLFTIQSLFLALRQAGFTRLQLAPWRPVARWTYPASEAIRTQGICRRGGVESVSATILGLLADVRSLARPRGREFVTVVAFRT